MSCALQVLVGFMGLCGVRMGVFTRVSVGAWGYVGGLRRGPGGLAHTNLWRDPFVSEC